MSRKPDPNRKPQLVAEILDYLLDKPLASLTFRKVARALGVSTYTLVYQFGTHAQLVADILSAIASRQPLIAEALDAHPTSLETYYAGLTFSWEWTLDPRNRQLQRLEFEAAMMEALDRATHHSSRSLYAGWVALGQKTFLAHGLTPAEAESQSRLVVDGFYGLQFDLVLNDDEARATAAFDGLITRHRARMEELLAAGGARID